MKATAQVRPTLERAGLSRRTISKSHHTDDCESTFSDISSSTIGAVATVESRKTKLNVDAKEGYVLCTVGVGTRLCLKKISTFTVIKVLQVICVIFVLIVTFAKRPIGLINAETGYVIDPNSPENTENGYIDWEGAHRPIIGNSPFQLFCVAVSRSTAFALVPPMVAVYLSKCKALNNVLHRTPLSLYMSHDTHELHEYSGKFITWVSLIHTIFHIFRWAAQRNLNLIYDTRAGLSGVIMVVSTLLASIPMLYWKSLKYEIRKTIHYIFFYVFAVATAFHAPISGLPWGGIIPILITFSAGLYTLDAIFVHLFWTEKVTKSTFQVLPSGVQLSMQVSDSFRRRGEYGGFAYVCLPWVDKNQWHAFSLHENPVDPTRREVFMQKTGDWTDAVHEALQRKTARPVWVQGPFNSPWSGGEWYDNQILIAAGIGITPALSAIRSRPSGCRRINLIWAVRDSTMLEFFMEHMYLQHEGWNLIFYTGEDPLNPAIEELQTNVRVIKSRPDFDIVIPNIIFGVESGKGLPETYVPDLPNDIEKTKRMLKENQQLSKRSGFTRQQTRRELTVTARKNGILLTGDLLMQVEDDNGSTGAPNRGIHIDVPATFERSAVQPSFKPWERNDRAQAYVKQLESRHVLSTYGILFCGGSSTLEKIVQRVSIEYHINLISESFQW